MSTSGAIAFLAPSSPLAGKVGVRNVQHQLLQAGNLPTDQKVAGRLGKGPGIEMATKKKKKKNEGNLAGMQLTVVIVIIIIITE